MVVPELVRGDANEQVYLLRMCNRSQMLTREKYAETLAETLTSKGKFILCSS